MDQIALPQDNHELANVFKALHNDDCPWPKDRVECKEIEYLRTAELLFPHAQCKEDKFKGGSHFLAGIFTCMQLIKSVQPMNWLRTYIIRL